MEINIFLSLRKSVITVDDLIHMWFQLPLTIIVIIIKSIFKLHLLSWKYNSHIQQPIGYYHLDSPQKSQTQYISKWDFLSTCSPSFNVTKISSFTQARNHYTSRILLFLFLHMKSVRSHDEYISEISLESVSSSPHLPAVL